MQNSHLAGRAPLLAPLLLLVAGSVAGNALAQEDEDTRRHGIFVESVEVNLVSVEVFASVDGAPVTDLTIDDFEVFDDGQPAEITHFARIEQGRRIDPDEPPLEEAQQPGEIESAARESSSVIVLVDQLLISPSSRKRVFDALSAELGALTGAGAQVMVLSKALEVTVEQGFSTNEAAIQSALDRLAATAPPGYVSEIRSIAEIWDIKAEAVESRQSGPGQPSPLTDTTELDAQAAYSDARGLSQRIHTDVSASLSTLGRFLDSLAGHPGRKTLLYVADRLPVRPAEQLWSIWWEKFGREHGARLGLTRSGPAELDLTLALEDLLSNANANRVAFYSIGTDSGVDFSSAASRSLSSPTLPAARLRQSTSGDGLPWLSQRTGGRTAPRSGAFDDFFEGLVQDLESYYSLAYASPHNGDGEIHRLEIRARRPGVELRHPTEYRDKSADQRMIDRMLTTINLGFEENPLDARIDAGKPDRKRDGTYTVPVEIHVPLANLVLVPGKTKHQGKLTIQLLARNEKGRLSDPVMIRMPLEVHHRDMSWALSQTVDYSTELALSAGRNTIAIAIHDDLGQTGSTIGLDIDAGN